MLSYILSKMNMMVFATGVFVIAVIFMSFISGTGDVREARNLLQSKASVIEEQLSTDSLCSIKVQSIPNTLTKGLGKDLLFYEMNFTSRSLGDKNILELSLRERGRDNLIASQSVYMRAAIVFVDPQYLEEGEPVDNYYHDEEEYSISLYPRGAFSPNSFVALKEVSGGQGILYIIPCTSTTRESCNEGITKTGCYILKKEFGANISEKEKLPSCFNVELEMKEFGGDVASNLTALTCKNILGENYFKNSYVGGAS